MARPLQSASEVNQMSLAVELQTIPLKADQDGVMRVGKTVGGSF
jgi:hypothetical protein